MPFANFLSIFQDLCHFIHLWKIIPFFNIFRFRERQLPPPTCGRPWKYLKIKENLEIDLKPRRRSNCSKIGLFQIFNSWRNVKYSQTTWITVKTNFLISLKDSVNKKCFTKLCNLTGLKWKFLKQLVKSDEINNSKLRFFNAKNF